MIGFPQSIYFASLLGGMILSYFSMPYWVRISERLGMVDDPGSRKIHDRTVPLAGGLGVAFAVAVPLVIGSMIALFGIWDPDQVELIVFGYRQRAYQLLAILIGAGGMLLLGSLDDRLELSPMVKFSGQVIVALLVAGAGVRITLFVDSALFSYVITVLWILTLVNAFNFLDNMNGLCAGLGVIATLTCAIGAALAGQYLVTSMTLLTAGSLIGFLPYNFPKGRVFLGDSGSHLVGFLVAIATILTTFYSDETMRRTPFAVVSPLLIVGVPLFDLASVVIIRWRIGKPFYLGDNNHISHRLVRAGWSRQGAVVLIWASAIALSVLSFAL